MRLGGLHNGRAEEHGGGASSVNGKTARVSPDT